MTRKKPREPFFARLRRRGRESLALTRTLVREPRRFPGEAALLLKRSFRTVWEARGGGYYACGFVVTFVWLELSTLAREIWLADGLVSFFGEQLLEFLFRFSLQSLGNTAQAFIWPVLPVERFGMWGGLGVLAGYWLFSRYLKARVSNWLFRESDDASLIS